MATHRLDAVVRLRERAEQKALEALGETVRLVTQAEAALAAAQEAARRDGRAAALAAMWDLHEAAHEQARRAVERAQAQLAAARDQEAAARAAHLKAYKDAEVIRRVATARKQEALRREEKLEAKALDELASVRHHQKGQS